jgi:hypothetical protein
MGKMKNYLIEISEALEKGEWQKAREMLAVFGEHAPKYLWAAVEDLATSEEWDTE